MSNLRSRTSSAERDAYFFFPSPYMIVTLTLPQSDRFDAMGYSIESAAETAVPQKAVEETDAIFIGGGNTFRLLKALQDLDLIEAIRHEANSGAPYIGSSAGSNVAGPTIKGEGHANRSAALVRLSGACAVSDQYLTIFDPDPNSAHMGETQEERILQFLEENDTPGRRHSRRCVVVVRRR